MAEIYSFPENMSERYDTLSSYLDGLTKDESNLVAALSNASAIINLCLDRINWAGFYLIDGAELVLGPFQGKPACVRIKIGRGVCGSAAEKDTPQLVTDVHDFPGHIACDADSRSEIVIPIHDKDGSVVGVLDIDSPETNRFSELDLQGLEKAVATIEKNCF